MVTLIAHDGMRSTLNRLRCHPPRVVATRPEAHREVAGRVAHALGRLTQAAAANPVPIPDPKLDL